MRRLTLVVVLSLATLAPVARAGADVDLDRLEVIWQGGDYARVLPELVAYRERTGVRTPQLDYMIATSACRTPGRQQLGDEFFVWILQNYNLSAANRSQVETQRRVCTTVGPLERLPATTPAALAGIVYHGKEGTRYESRPAGNTPTTVVAVVPPQELTRRLFVPSDAGRAMASVTRRIGPDNDVQAVGQFVLAAPRVVASAPVEAPTGPSVGPLNVASPSLRKGITSENVGSSPTPSIDPEDLLKNRPALPPMEQRAVTPATQGIPHAQAMVQQMAPRTAPAPADLKAIGQDLENYLRFFVAEYGMRRPAFLITVYFADTPAQLHDLARTLHGIELSPGSIGYSFSPDQSMVGWADGKAYGTFAHELFHLAVRNTFGDIPPFLDEGMAALYEVSTFQGGRAVGVPNWRGPILTKAWTQRPSIKDLVQMNRSAFDDIAGPSDQALPGNKQSVNHATARYLMLYLQERGELSAVYKTFFTRPLSDRPAEQSVALMEAALGRPLDAVDTDFVAWFKALPSESSGGAPINEPRPGVPQAR